MEVMHEGRDVALREVGEGGAQEARAVGAPVRGLGDEVQGAHGQLVTAALVTHEGAPPADPDRATVGGAAEADGAGAADEGDPEAV
jgi:hypothetical protein